MNTTEPLYAAFIGIDWADQQHVLSLQEANSRKIQRGTLEQKPEAIAQWVAQLRARYGGQPVAIAVEQSRGALLSALLDHEFLVIYPLHPTTVARFRAAFRSSGAKSDPVDADDILAILTKHLDQLRPLCPEDAPTRLLRRLVQARRQAVDLRTAHVLALQAAIKEYFPQLEEILSGNFTSRLAADFLQRWPTLQSLQQAKPTTLKRFFYGHNLRSPQLLERLLQVADHGQPLTQDPAILEGGSRAAQMYAQQIQPLNQTIEAYEQRIQQLVAAHPEAPLFRDLPGAGPNLGARVLAFFGTDRSRFQSAQDAQACCGIAPVTKQSGQTQTVAARQACPKFQRQSFHEFARASLPQCQWARNYVDYGLAQGKSYHTVIRALAYKWIRILYRCWQNRTPYDESFYMQRLIQTGSVYATYHLRKT